MKREPNTIYVLSLSYGKDSLACLEAIRILGLPLDRIVHAEVWATDTIPADLPPMVEFKKFADKIIKERYGVEVEHVCATKKTDRGGFGSAMKQHSIQDLKKESLLAQSKASLKQKEAGAKSLNTKTMRLTYEDIFYRERKKIRSARGGEFKIYGFPMRRGNWCNNLLKTTAINLGVRWAQRAILHGGAQERGFSNSPCATGDINVVQYLGIAADEPKRIERLNKKGFILPLVLVGWDESYCRDWCKKNNLLSPIYTTATRGGCWFCHNQSVGQLRLLRKNYPDLWSLLLKWDKDSPVSFKADGHTVHDFDKRFQLEDEGKLRIGDKFRWSYLESPPPIQMTIFDYLEEIKDENEFNINCNKCRSDRYNCSD